MTAPTPTTDLPARLAIANYAPFAFLGTKLVFLCMFAFTWFIEQRVNWPALIVALCMLPAIVITWVNRETLRIVCAENADMKRDLRSVGRLSL